MGRHAVLESLVAVVVLSATVLQAAEAVTTDAATTKVCVTHRFTVEIVSGMPREAPDLLKVHCKSKDDDLGYHELYPREKFPWTFCESFLENTLYTCDLSWGPRYASFVAFSSKDFRCGGGYCNWGAAPDGIYYAPAGGAWVKKFDWHT